MVTVFAAGVKAATGVAATDEGEGGVCVALTCLVFVGVALPFNNLLKPRCIEQDESSVANATINNKTEYFFILFASKQCAQSYISLINTLCGWFNCR